MESQLVELADGFSCYVIADKEAQFNYREIFEDHCYDVPGLPNAPFIIDAGANIGLFSIYAKQKHPQAKVIAFEPAPACLNALRLNLELHEALDVTVYPYALGPEVCNKTLAY